MERLAPLTAPVNDGEAGADTQTVEDMARCRAVEDALFRRACGYEVPVRKTYKVKRIEYDSMTGKKVSEREELEIGMEEEHVPPDVRVCAYFLNNRDPSRWREHPTVVAEDTDGAVDYPDMAPTTCPPPETHGEDL